MLSRECAAALRLCRFVELSPGEARGFDPDMSGRDRLFVVRRGERVDAWLNACPHYALADAVPLAWRRNGYMSADGRHIVCAGHGALFEPDNGQCIQGPCVGEQLQRVPLTLTETGELWVSNENFSGV
ncbi:Rieske (2Fe-2S) domain-containing protein [Caballeronia glebae]|uniref:Rieske (2Fe-2S) domain-containing protein n=1 Tax=Caballeronia glebae TaxID=1777143 RepID=A0A158A3U3_9BURK|nr:Rieske 2Fe-2S domain-containing protein [Caballeronia glebae]SAK52423.1 Rieske (2Fe-2S) domain-containing protein [Caballeronia glebae]